MNDARLDTRLGPLAWRSTGEGPTLVFFAGALANGDLWRDVVSGLADRYRCVTVDLPLGAHRWPLSADADRSATSLARLLLDCIELLDVDPVAVVANDTAGGLLLLALAEEHPALERIGALVLTNCDNGDQFPPDALKKGSTLARWAPRLARTLLRAQLRTPARRRKLVASVAATPLDDARDESFFAPLQDDPRVAGDLVAAMAGFRPDLLVGASPAIERFERPVLLVWGDSCDFFPLEDARRLASAFPFATLVTVPGAKTWVPVDDPATLTDAIATFLPTLDSSRTEGGLR